MMPLQSDIGPTLGPVAELVGAGVFLGLAALVRRDLEQELRPAGVVSGSIPWWRWRSFTSVGGFAPVSRVPVVIGSLVMAFALAWLALFEVTDWDLLGVIGALFGFTAAGWFLWGLVSPWLLAEHV